MPEKEDNTLNIIIFLIVGYIVYAVIFAPSRPISSANLAPSAVNINLNQLADPIQTPYFGKDYIPYEAKNLSLKIYPKAKYKIYAAVMGKSRYYTGWEANFAPYDLALAWNKLMLSENQQGINYSQSGRWYYYNYNEKFPLDPSYIAPHSANVHIIPANQNVLRGIEYIRKEDKIYLEGYLVYISGTYNGGEVWWNSSLSRNDTGDGACEVFYVTLAGLGHRIFK